MKPGYSYAHIPDIRNSNQVSEAISKIPPVFTVSLLLLLITPVRLKKSPKHPHELPHFAIFHIYDPHWFPYGFTHVFSDVATVLLILSIIEKFPTIVGSAQYPEDLSTCLPPFLLESTSTLLPTHQ
jgi:hypothetical protein